MLALVATAVPLTYRVPVVPLSVTATCDHVFNGSCDAALSRCSPPAPLVVIANRGPDPAFTVRNMLAVVPVPMSNTRDHVEVADGFTQAAMVKLETPVSIPEGIAT